MRKLIIDYDNNIPKILGNAEFRVRLFLFRAQLTCSRRKLSTCVLQARREDDVHGCTSGVSAGRTETVAHGRSLQEGTPTVGALGDALWMKIDVL